MQLGEFIYQFRKEHDLTMHEFAARCGLSKGYVSMLEKGQHPQSSRALVPSIDTYRKLSSGMGIPVDEIFSLIDADSYVSVNNTFSLTPDEEQLIADYRDADEITRSNAALLLRSSAEQNRSAVSLSRSSAS